MAKAANSKAMVPIRCSDSYMLLKGGLPAAFILSSYPPDFAVAVAGTASLAGACMFGIVALIGGNRIGAMK